MGLSKFVKRLKKSLRHMRTNTDKHHANDGPSAPTPVPPDNDSSSVTGAFPDSPSCGDQRTPQLGSGPIQGAESPSSGTSGPTGFPTAHPDPPPSQMIPLPSEATPSLWNRAYEALRASETQLVDQYESLLSRELEGHASSAERLQNTTSQEDDLDRTENLINANPDDRQAQLKIITDLGLRRVEEKQTKYTIFGHNFVLGDQVAQAVQFIQAIKGIVNEAVKVSPEASLAWAGVCVLLPVLTNPSAAKEANRDGLSYVTSRIHYYVELERLLWPENLCDSGLKTEFDSHVVDLYQCILEFQIKSVLGFYRRWLANMGRDLIRHDSWEKMLSKIKELEQIVREESSTVNTIASRSTLEAIRNGAEQQYNTMQSLVSVAEKQLAEQRRTNQILEDRPISLPVVNEACYDSADVQDSPRCEKGTRICIRETIARWADEESEETLFWLVGPAGTGKSTIARTVADYFAGEKRLVAGYFFKRGEQGRNDTSRLFATLATQLAEAIPSFKGCLRESLDGLDKDSVEKKSLEFQFDKLLWLPLMDLSLTDKSPLSRVIIIDALDECERPEHLTRVIALLSKLCSITWLHFRVFLTSRSAPNIVDAFEPLLRNKTACSLEVHREFSDDTRADIQIFLKTRFADIRIKRGVQQDPWPAAEDLDHLVQLATSPEPLFIYAATLCRFVYDEQRPRNPKNQLKLWLKQCEDSKTQLHQIYDPILSQVFLGNEQAEFDQQLQFLGALVLLATPLPALSLAVLLNIDMDDVNWWLPELHAVLDIPPEPQRPIRLLHKSFSDFLLSSDDSNTSMYRVDPAQTHTRLAARCIQCMAAGLKQDICHIRKLDATREDVEEYVIDHYISAELKYACLHWVYHLRGSGGSFDNNVYTFLYEHLLHWLEVLSLLGRILEGVIAIRELLELIKVHERQQPCNIPSEFIDFVKDANRVISSFGSTIECKPLQTYGALLFFSPVASKVRQKFWNQRMPRLCTIQGVKSDWDAHLQTLEGHFSSVQAVAFSPDGQLLASASFDGAVFLWNTVSGTHLQTLEGHSDSVDVITFSSNGQLLASGSRDRTVRIWNAITGTHLHTLKVSERVRAVAFSQDSEFLVAASHDHSVQHWNAKTGAHLKKTVKSPGLHLDAVAFSPDSQLVSLAFVNRIQLWNLETGAHQYMVEGHIHDIRVITFSPDGQFIASGSDDKTVRLWNVADGTLKYVLEGHRKQITALAFSQDGQLLASASIWDREPIRIWNVTTGAHQNTLIHNESCIIAMAFSPDSQLLASGSVDQMVKLWDARLQQQSFDGHKDSIKSVVLSPDSQLVASSSRDNTIQLWDASTGLHQRILGRHSEWGVCDLTFSPDSKLLASYDNVSLMIWNVENGKSQQIIDSRNGLVRAVAYSSDGQLVASGISDTIKLYKQMTGACLYTLKGHRAAVRSMAFSPDCQILASWSDDDKIRLWDTGTGTLRHILEVRYDSAYRLLFSPNGQFIAAVYLRTISWWDTATGAHQKTLDVMGQILVAAFSPNNRLLATVTGLSDSETFDLWDPTTGEHRHILHGQWGHATYIIFSPDSQLIAVASRNRTIRLWSAVTYIRLRILKTPNDFATMIKFSPDGQLIASATADRTIQVWETITGEQLQVMQYDKGFAREISFLPEELVVSVSNDIKDHLWNLWNPMTLEFYRYDITDASRRTTSDLASYGVNLDAFEVWITNDGENLIWLPPDYRPTHRQDKPRQIHTRWAIRGSTIFIGCASGRIIRFQAA